jgi:glycosyltransferase involved in cell wall biosynthesis
MIIGLEATRANHKHKTGTEWYAWHIIQEFKKINTPHKFVLYYNQELEPALLSRAEHFIFKQLNWPFKKLWTHFRLGFELVVRPVDIFFATNAIPFFHRGKMVLTVHDLGFMRHPELYHPLARIYHRLSHYFGIKQTYKILVPSEATKKDVLYYFPDSANKTQVVYLGFDDQQFKLISDLEKEEIKNKFDLPNNFILYIGRLETKKNIQNLLRAYKVSDKRWPLVLAGSAGRYGIDEINELANDPSIKSNVFILGYVSQKDYVRLMGAASAFVFPSKFEGFGIPLLEAMACGVPIICSDLPVLHEVAGECAIYFDPNKVEDISQAINQISSDENLAKQLSNAGLARVKRFSWAKCARESFDYIVDKN